MSKNQRSGGKFTGNHTTLIPAAITVADIAAKSDTVYRITPGFIKTGLKSANGNRRVKFTVDGNYLLISVRDNISVQELHVYARNIDEAVKIITAGAKKANLSVSDKIGQGPSG